MRLPWETPQQIREVDGKEIQCILHQPSAELGNDTQTQPPQGLVAKNSEGSAT